MSSYLRKVVDIGPGGVIYPGSAQDYRYASNAALFRDSGTPWIRMWADWPSLQPDPLYAADDPAGPGYWKLQALDAQIAQACADGLRVMLMPYRFPPWANATAALAAQRNTDAEISFQYWDRMSAAAWSRYVRNGRNPAVYTPSRRALEYRIPDVGYALDGDWSRFFELLYRRYHYGLRASGRYVTGFELVNEPNLQLWPQQSAPAPGAADPFALTQRTIGGRVAQLLATARAVAARYGSTTKLYAPSASDSDTATSRLYTRWDEFVPLLLDACDAIGYRANASQGWSHHNYSDVEYRTTATRTQRVRVLLAGRWSGYAVAQAPTVFVTEGGARLSKMASLYPAEDPRQAQAKSLRDAWALHATDAGAGAGVAMLAQYLLYGDVNFDCGLLDPYPSTVRRPAYDAWKAFPRSP